MVTDSFLDFIYSSLGKGPVLSDVVIFTCFIQFCEPSPLRPECERSSLPTAASVFLARGAEAADAQHEYADGQRQRRG